MTLVCVKLTHKTSQSSLSLDFTDSARQQAGKAQGFQAGLGLWAYVAVPGWYVSSGIPSLFPFTN